MKKFLSIAIVLVMVLSLSLSLISVSAAGTSAIQIDNAIDGKIYTAYKLFDLTKNGDNYAYSIAADSPWYAFFTGAGKDYVVLDTAGNITFKAGITDDEVKALAALAITYTKGTDVSSTATSKPASGSTVTIDGLDLGYYLVDSSFGTLCALVNSDSTFHAVEKNANPTVDKEADEETVEIGQTVNYTATITVGSGTNTNYVFHDKMSAGLTFDSASVEVQVDGVDVDAANYTLYVASDPSIEDDCTFHIVFDTKYTEALEKNTKIVITYSATVNADAIVHKALNEAWLEFDESNKTESDTTDTKVYKAVIEKTDGTNPLAGAQFKVYDAMTSGNEIKFVATGTPGVYRIALTGETSVDVLDTDASGKLTLQGLEGKTYYLEETKAPDGYNKLTARVALEFDGAADAFTELKVVNNSGTVLPETGGIGTTLFITFGTIAVLVAGVLLVTKKRMSKLVD